MCGCVCERETQCLCVCERERAESERERGIGGGVTGKHGVPKCRQEGERRFKKIWSNYTISGIVYITSYAPDLLFNQVDNIS